MSRKWESLKEGAHVFSHVLTLKFSFFKKRRFVKKQTTYKLNCHYQLSFSSLTSLTSCFGRWCSWWRKMEMALDSVTEGKNAGNNSPVCLIFTWWFTRYVNEETATEGTFNGILMHHGIYDRAWIACALNCWKQMLP